MNENNLVSPPPIFTDIGGKEKNENKHPAATYQRNDECNNCCSGVCSNDSSDCLCLSLYCCFSKDNDKCCDCGGCDCDCANCDCGGCDCDCANCDC